MLENFKTALDNFNDPFIYMQLSKVKGRNYLIKNGYKQMPNVNYYENEEFIANYNSILKYWLISKK
jgi:hypothetical protein